MNRSIFLLSAIAFFMKVVYGSGIYSHYEFNEDVYVKHLAGRSRRSAPGGVINPTKYEFPERMTFKIHPNTKREIHLDLELNKRARRDYVPMVRHVGGVDTPIVHDKEKNYAFYHVLDKNAAAGVMVECPDNNGPCHMTGHYFDGQNQFAIEPDFSKAPLLNSMPHKTYKIGRQDHNMTGDISLIKGSESVDLGFLADVATSKRQSSSTPPQAIVETLILIDYTLYSYFLNFKGSVAAAEACMQRYYEQLMCMVDLRYQTLENVDMRIYPKQIKLMPNAADSPWLTAHKFTQNGKEYLNCVNSLDALHAWALQNLNSLGDFDHLVTLTSINLATQSAQGAMENAGILGIANMKKDPSTNYPVTLTCDHLGGGVNISASLTEDLADADRSLVVAHEMAHNWGVQHDGDYSQASCFKGSNQYYVMEATVKTVFTAQEKTHPWTFSSCSSAVIKYTLETLVADNNGASCVQSGSATTNDVNNLHNPLDFNGDFSFDNMCKMAYDPSSQRCTYAGEVETDICHNGIRCTTSMGCNGRAAVLAGAPCGGGTCIEGACVGAANPNPTPAPTPAPTPPQYLCRWVWNSYYWQWQWYCPQTI